MADALASLPRGAGNSIPEDVGSTTAAAAAAAADATSAAAPPSPLSTSEASAMESDDELDDTKDVLHELSIGALVSSAADLQKVLTRRNRLFGLQCGATVDRVGSHIALLTEIRLSQEREIAACATRAAVLCSDLAYRLFLVLDSAAGSLAEASRFDQENWVKVLQALAGAVDTFGYAWCVNDPGVAKELRLESIGVTLASVRPTLGAIARVAISGIHLALRGVSIPSELATDSKDPWERFDALVAKWGTAKNVYDLCDQCEDDFGIVTLSNERALYDPGFYEGIDTVPVGTRACNERAAVLHCMRTACDCTVYAYECEPDERKVAEAVRRRAVLDTWHAAIERAARHVPTPGMQSKAQALMLLFAFPPGSRLRIAIRHSQQETYILPTVMAQELDPDLFGTVSRYFGMPLPEIIAGADSTAVAQYARAAWILVLFDSLLCSYVRDVRFIDQFVLFEWQLPSEHNRLAKRFEGATRRRPLIVHGCGRFFVHSWSTDGKTAVLQKVQGVGEAILLWLYLVKTHYASCPVSGDVSIDPSKFAFFAAL